MGIDQEEDSVDVGRDVCLEYDADIAINPVLCGIRVPVQVFMMLRFVGPTFNFRMDIQPIVDEIPPADDNDNDNDNDDDDDDDDDDDEEDIAELDGEDWEAKFEPANRVSIEELERVKVEGCLKEECGCCSVCLDEFESGCEATRMPCSHLFHGDCIVNWLQNSNFCPLCRFQLPS